MQRDSIVSKRYGVVFFDNDEAPKSGWACTSSGNPFFFMNLNEIDENTIWFSNISLDSMKRHESIKGLYIKPFDYLFTSLNNLCAELGLFGIANSSSIKVIYDVFEKVMGFHEHYVGASNITGSSLLNLNIRKVFGDLSYLESDLVNPLKAEIVKTYSNNLKSVFELIDENHKTLLFHRFEYAKKILSQGIPVGRWTKLSLTILNTGQKPLHKWIMSCTKPMLISVSVSFHDDLAKKLFYLNRDNPCLEWVTIDEYKWLSNYANMDVCDALICEGYAPSPLVLPQHTSGSKSSFSFGLYCENIWTSICIGADGGLDNSIASIWILAMDRVQCLQKSYQIEKETSLLVVACSFGRLVVSYAGAVDGYICRSAFTSELISPMPSPAVAFQRTLPDQPTLSQFMQVVIERAAIGFLQKLDEVALTEMQEASEQKFSLNKLNKLNISI